MGLGRNYENAMDANKETYMIHGLRSASDTRRQLSKFGELFGVVEFACAEFVLNPIRFTNAWCFRSECSSINNGGGFPRICHLPG